VIDDVKGQTLASASSLEKDMRAKSGANVDAAKAVGTMVAKRAVEEGRQGCRVRPRQLPLPRAHQGAWRPPRESGLNF